jgi:hypothetical protein
MSSLDQFVQQLPGLLRQLADPTTQYTSQELWCRIHSAGWDLCVPVLLAELKGSDDSVKRLVMHILVEHHEHASDESLELFHDVVEQLLEDESRVVRMAAIHAVRDLSIWTPTVAASLRWIVCHDHPVLAREALVSLMELDNGIMDELAQKLRPTPN